MKNRNYFNKQNTISYFDAVRGVLNEEYSDMEIENILSERFVGMSPEEIESFWKSVGNTLKKAAPTIAPIIGGAVGTAIAPGVGTAIGSSLGKQLGNLAGGTPKNRSQLTQRSTPQIVPSPRVATNPSASNQLLLLLNNPQLIRSILGQVLGTEGRNSVEVVTNNGNKQIPFGAFMNALSELAERAAIEANENIEDEITSSYLQDEYGEYVCDPSSSEERAEVLMNLLNQNYNKENIETEGGEFDVLTQWFIEAELIN